MKYLELKNKSVTQLRGLGLQNWDNKGLHLIPSKHADNINPKQKVTCIDGTETTFEKCDKDTRFGFYAYGVFPGQKS